ncbi:hypothetical protein K438DRAFT_2000198 [Mycena galopus ATCC 62051]|nr:hypothetical protein K438DRAFT_2000198 [Mycena galopus ATCC 62051]
MSETNGLPNIIPAALIVDPDEGSVDMSGDDMSEDDVDWERLIEAEAFLAESRRTWSDTPSSVIEMQAFEPPRSPEDIEALLQHSLQNYDVL